MKTKIALAIAALAGGAGLLAIGAAMLLNALRTPPVAAPAGAASTPVVPLVHALPSHDPPAADLAGYVHASQRAELLPVEPTPPLETRQAQATVPSPALQTQPRAPEVVAAPRQPPVLMPQPLPVPVAEAGGHQFFQEPLWGYGGWVFIGGSGYCWQPRENPGHTDRESAATIEHGRRRAGRSQPQGTGPAYDQPLILPPGRDVYGGPAKPARSASQLPAIKQESAQDQRSTLKKVAEDTRQPEVIGRPALPGRATTPPAPSLGLPAQVHKLQSPSQLPSVNAINRMPSPISAPAVSLPPLTSRSRGNTFHRPPQ